jgi:2-oxoglutarate ferredoxin oxidoreductase subunit beta
MGVFVSLQRPTFEEMMTDQLARAKSKKGDGDLQKLLDGDETWTIQ